MGVCARPSVSPYRFGKLSRGIEGGGFTGPRGEAETQQRKRTGLVPLDELVARSSQAFFSFHKKRAERTRGASPIARL